MAENWLALAQNYEFHLNLRRNIGELDEGALRSMAPYQISVRTAEGALGVIANVRQHTGVVLAHDPLRHWQPIGNRIKPKLVRGALEDIGAAIGAGNELEAR